MKRNYFYLPFSELFAKVWVPSVRIAEADTKLSMCDAFSVKAGKVAVVRVLGTLFVKNVVSRMEIDSDILENTLSMYDALSVGMGK
jgi:hypothetical protein